MPPQERRRSREPAELVDPRKPVSEFKREMSPQELRDSLPATLNKDRDAAAAQQEAGPWRDSPLFREVACKVITRLCGVSVDAPKKEREVEPLQDYAPRKWYRIHPETETTYFVRPDAGLRGRVPGFCCPEEEEEEEVPPPPPPPLLLQRVLSWNRDGTESHDTSMKLSKQHRSPKPPAKLPVGSEARKRRSSLPAKVERRIGLKIEDLTDFNDDLCVACAAAKREVILLPCRHGVLCEGCLRRASFYCWRKGYRCPMCRRRAREVVRIYDEAVFPQYGYAIKALA